MTEGQGTGRRNLVIVRAGKASLHPRWLAGAEQRNWDLLVSYYDPAASHTHPDDVRVEVHRGGKWDGLYHSLADDSLIDRYDYFWLPDDDIDARSSDIDAIFDAMARFDLSLAQPALTHDSYYSHFIVNRCPSFTLRYTNYIEIMVPCLRRDLLRAVRADFAGSMSGFGMDYIWPRLLQAGELKSAILDFVTVHHTRPVGVHLKTAMSGQGRTPEQEAEHLKSLYGLSDRIVPLVYAAIDDTGRLLAGRRRLAWRMARAYLGVLREFSDRRRARKKIVQMIRRQMTKPFDLSLLERSAPPSSGTARDSDGSAPYGRVRGEERLERPQRAQNRKP